MRRIIFFIVLLSLPTLASFAQEEEPKKKTRVNIEHYDMATYSKNLGDMQRLIGHVRIRHDSAYFFCDSAYFYEKSNSFDAYQNVHIIVNDTVEMFSDMLHYDGDARFAEFFDNVRLRDDSTTLYTEYLTYDRDLHLACYPDSATTIRGDKQLVSRLGYYRDRLKEFSFFDNVQVTTPEYQMFTDTLHYNTSIEKMWFHGPTTIVNKENVIQGEHGYYLVEEDIAYFDKKPQMYNETQRIKSDSIYYDHAIGFAKALDHVDMIDTSYKVVMRGNYVEMWENRGVSFATDSAYMISYDKGDSLYIHGDTLFVHFDKHKNELEKLISRRNVRFFKSDMQGKCDTLTYLMADSTIHLRVDPVLWAEDSQMTGDQIDIKVFDQKIDFVLQKGNGFIVVRDTVEGYNQIKGADIISHFHEGRMHHVSVEGESAETIYWIRDDDTSLIGIDVAKSKTMVITMKNNEISQIKSYRDISETMYPEDDLKEADRYLSGFKWHGDQRPQNKDDIFRVVIDRTNAELGSE